MFYFGINLPYMDLEKAKEMKCHYIIGMGHSGTTLLSAILNSSGEILVIPEIHAAMYFFQPKSGKKKFTTTDIEDLINYYGNFYFAKKMKFHPDRIKKNIEHIKSYAAFLNNTYLSLEYPGKPNERIKYIVEKNPSYTFYVKDLLKIFPSAKFVLMIRDPRGYINSCLQKNEAPGTKKHHPAFYMYVWKRYYDEMEELMRCYPEKCQLIHYEDLTREPEKTLKNICTHLGIPFSSQMLEHHKSEFIVTVKNDSFFQDTYFKTKVQALASSINAQRTDAWKKNISGNILSLINSVLHKESLRAGYADVTSDTLPPGFFFLRMKYQFLIFLYFLFARRFYHFPVKMREMIRKQV